MSIEITKISSILQKGNFYSKVSFIAESALKDSIVLRKKYIKINTSKKNTTDTVSLDFTNTSKKRTSSKAYRSLVKGIKIVTR